MRKKTITYPNLTKTTTYWPNGARRTEMWSKRETEIVHHLTKPAIRQWSQKDRLLFEGWYQEDQPHRLTGPAAYSFDSRGNIHSKSWWLWGVLYWEVPGTMRLTTAPMLWFLEQRLKPNAETWPTETLIWFKIAFAGE